MQCTDLKHLAPRIGCRPVSRAARLQVRAAVGTRKIVVRSNVTKEQLEVSCSWQLSKA
jgi:hypothetical protein